jgi:hypothetical protein
MRNSLMPVFAGFVATLVMTVVMFVVRLYLGAPFIPELIAQGLLPTYSAGLSDFSSITSAGFSVFILSTLAHLGAGTILGAFFLYQCQRFKLRNPVLLSLAYSILLWLVFSTILLPLLGFGFFGQYFAGIPAIANTALFVFFLVYGLVLSSYFVGMRKRA